MTQKLACLVLITGAILLLSGCSKDDSTGGGIFGPPQNGGTAGDYYPLKIGDTWTYQWTAWTTAADTATGTYTVSLVDTATAFNSYLAYQYQVTGGTGGWFVIMHGQLRLYGGTNTPTDSTVYYLWLAEPIQVGTSWYIHQPVQTDTSQFQIAAINASATVPAGTFSNCVQINLAAAETDWFAPSVGWVKSTYTWNGGTNHEEDILTSYHLE
jgi:hypothetical protein